MEGGTGQGAGMMQPLLEARGLNKRFGAVTAARDIEVAVTAQEVVGIIGANGAGKTTFVNMVTGWLKPSSGRVLFEGRDITGRTPREITRLGICRSFQVPQVFGSASVHDNLLIALGIAETGGGLGLHRLRRPELTAKADALLARYRIDGYRDQLAGTLPQGVRKLLDIAMAMVAGPKVLLLDEPTSGISSEEKFELMDAVMAVLRETGVTVLFVEHDMEIVERYVGRVLAFYQGEIICDAPPLQALADPAVRQLVTGEAGGER
ncbi:MAG TPA: ABC transporter ATP-binding protein, partial [Thalassobaculum sp.]